MRKFNCKRCGVEQETKHSHKKFCNSCSMGRPWDVWSLDYKLRLTKLCQMAENRSSTKQLPFDLTPESLIRLWEENEGCCALTGRLFDLTSWGKKGQVNPNTPSVDRIKPELGYVKGNVRLIVYHLNVALSDFGGDAFEQLAKDYLLWN